MFNVTILLLLTGAGLAAVNYTVAQLLDQEAREFEALINMIKEMYESAKRMDEAATFDDSYESGYPHDVLSPLRTAELPITLEAVLTAITEAQTTLYFNDAICEQRMLDLVKGQEAEARSLMKIAAKLLTAGQVDDANQVALSIYKMRDGHCFAQFLEQALMHDDYPRGTGPLDRPD